MSRYRKVPNTRYVSTILAAQSPRLNSLNTVPNSLDARALDRTRLGRVRATPRLYLPITVVTSGAGTVQYTHRAASLATTRRLCPTLLPPCSQRPPPPQPLHSRRHRQR